jgi:signal transduction histidine kinase
VTTAFFIYRQKSEAKLSRFKLAQKLLLTTINQVAEMEREFISKNLHDEVGSSLNIIKMNMARIQRYVDNPGIVSNAIAESIEQLSESISNIRNISNELSTPTLTKLGLEQGLAELFRKINSLEQIDVVFEPSGSITSLSALIELHLYRITQEVLNNIIKHAGASKILVSLFIENNRLRISISHNGKGISNRTADRLAASSKGMGLRHIQSRAQQIDAKVIYRSDKDHDSNITIELAL